MNEHGGGGQGHWRGGVGECLGEGCVFQAGRACTHEKLEDAKAGLGFTGKGYLQLVGYGVVPTVTRSSEWWSSTPGVIWRMGLVRKIKRLEGASRVRIG